MLKCCECHPITYIQVRGTKIGVTLLVLTALAAAVLVPLSLYGNFKAPMQNWMTQSVLKHAGARWIWIASGGLVAIALGAGLIHANRQLEQAKGQSLLDMTDADDALDKLPPVEDTNNTRRLI